MKRPPVPRPRIYDLYWYYASERQQMFTRRVTGEPGPWTDDPRWFHLHGTGVFYRQPVIRGAGR